MPDDLKSRLSVVEDRQDRFERNVQQSICEVKEALVRMEKTLERMARLEERHYQHTDSIGRIFKRLDGMDQSIQNLHVNVPQNTSFREAVNHWKNYIAAGLVLSGLIMLAEYFLSR